jgi:hypothetical protein
MNLIDSLNKRIQDLTDQQEQMQAMSDEYRRRSIECEKAAFSADQRREEVVNILVSLAAGIPTGDEDPMPPAEPVRTDLSAQEPAPAEYPLYRSVFDRNEVGVYEDK